MKQERSFHSIIFGIIGFIANVIRLLIILVFSGGAIFFAYTAGKFIGPVLKGISVTPEIDIFMMTLMVIGFNVCLYFAMNPTKVIK